MRSCRSRAPVRGTGLSDWGAAGLPGGSSGVSLASTPMVLALCDTLARTWERRFRHSGMLDREQHESLVAAPDRLLHDRSDATRVELVIDRSWLKAGGLLGEERVVR